MASFRQPQERYCPEQLSGMIWSISYFRFRQLLIPAYGCVSCSVRIKQWFSSCKSAGCCDDVCTPMKDACRFMERDSFGTHSVSQIRTWFRLTRVCQRTFLSQIANTGLLPYDIATSSRSRGSRFALSGETLVGLAPIREPTVSHLFKQRHNIIASGLTCAMISICYC